MMKRRLKNALATVVMTVYAVMLVVYSEQITEDMRAAVMRCINVIIPSLFAFMAISQLITRSGAYIYISKPFKPIAWLICLPGELVFLFLLSNTAGYPVGASMIRNMVQEGSLDRRSGARLLCTSYNGGPAFFCSVVGVVVFGSSKVGMIIFLSIVLANMTAAIVLNRLFPIKYDGMSKGMSFSPSMISDSVADAGESLMKICGMILAFQTVSTLITQICGDFFRENEGIAALSFLEISNLSELEGLPYRLLPVVAAAGAFGGLCVIMQIKTVVGDAFSMLPFLFARIFCAILSAAWCVLIYHFLGDKSLSAASQSEFIVNFNNFIPSLCLIMMIFLTVLQKRLDFSRKV